MLNKGCTDQSAVAGSSAAQAQDNGRARLEPTEQGQDDDDNENKTDNPRRAIPPASTVSPPRKDTEQDKNEDNDKDCA